MNGELTFRKEKPSRLSHSFVFNNPLLLMSRKQTDFGARVRVRVRVRGYG
jgi:hypothetical protein